MLSYTREQITYKLMRTVQQFDAVASICGSFIATEALKTLLFGAPGLSRSLRSVLRPSGQNTWPQGPQPVCCRDNGYVVFILVRMYVCIDALGSGAAVLLAAFVHKRRKDM